MANPPTDPHTAALLGAMRQYWGYDEFRPLQREAMTSVMEGRDSVVVLPTGGGKSLCYQVPAIAMGGMAVVVSPLISLMKDQVDALRNCGVAADFVNSSLSAEERREVSDRVQSGETKLLYAAPERLLMTGTLKFLQQQNVSFVAIDEAHCISSWGHDFRPEYRGMRVLKDAFPHAAVHAYTATASEAVRDDIAKQLGLSDPSMLVGSFDRPNLAYRVRSAQQRLQQIAAMVERHKGEPGIVYCISRKEVEKTAAALVELGCRAAPYHAGLSPDQRKKNQDDFINDRLEVVVATVAFGMGIDKPNVRFVVHAGMPKSVEHYQQESGRAGRDSLEADCLLLYSRSDAVTWRRMIENPSEGGDADSIAAGLRALEGISRYCAGVTCRHRMLVEHFGQAFENDNCGACDVCLGELDLVDDPVVLSQKILSCVARLDQRYGADYVCKVLCGSTEQRIVQSGHDSLSTHGLLADERAANVRDWVEQLVAQAYLIKAGEYGVLQLTDSGLRLLKGDGDPKLLKAAAKAAPSRRESRSSAESWEGVDRPLFERLRALRSKLAGELSVPAYIVFGDASLRDLARRRPTTLEAFRQAQGVGEKKLSDYGEAFIAEISAHCSETGAASDVEVEAPAPVVATPEKSMPGASSLAAFPFFRDGLSVDEAAEKMGRAVSTVQKYLSDYLKHEQITDPTPWVPRATALRIEEALEACGPGRLRPVFEHLGEEVSYEEIRVVATCVANRQQA
ncbi:ATP-dependent DNA helicase RecQ [Pseudobythopirellula maris]|uniref:DNA helicase RecQ n=1 Tax=Pseudobythopirellula maris TaxID=2527991 RepID=A0A5C5ZK11_9BACT|nr:DNA helicase RecQ [Pseudobythopirellula maris]TWT87458.1 ATP-dependent DNA helicase RecQ [Pseudobythopirellula maris]